MLLQLLLLLPLTTATTPPKPCTATTPTATTTTTTAAATGVTNLGLQLFRALATTPAATGPAATVPNTLISPFSLWTALTLAYIGAEGESKVQLGNALGLHAKEGVLQLLKDYRGSIAKKTQADGGVSFDSASRLYLDQSFTLATCRDELADLVVTLDLINQPQESAAAINAFVSSKTQGLIPTIISPDVLGPDAQLVIPDAVFFKGTWRNPFDPTRTETQPFYPLGSDEGVMVQMMAVKDLLIKFGHSSELHAMVAEIPYSSGTFNMTVIAPSDHSPAGFKKTVQALTRNNLKSARDALKDDYVFVTMPKFEIKTEYKDMKNVMASVGVKDVFDPKLADFSSYSPDIFISDFVHKAVVRVDEQGTEAAGATAIVFVTKITKSLHLSRPFIFVIHDGNSVFFIGSYVQP